MADALLVLNVDVKVAYQDDAAIRADTFLATTELARLHVALHDVHAVLLVEGDAGHLVKADHVVLTDQTSAALGGVLNEHLCHRRLATGNQVGIGRDLLEQMALAGATRAEFDKVVVALHKRNHAQEQRIFLSCG